MLILCVVSPAFAGEPDPRELVQKLGDEQFRIREEAQSSLRQLGKKAWPALEEAHSRTEDAELRDRAGQLLRPMGWIPPRHRKQLTQARLKILRGTDPEAIRKTIREIAESGADGIEALKVLYRLERVKAKLSMELSRRTYFPGESCEGVAKVQNQQSLPGWHRPLELKVDSEPESWPFGREVRFFEDLPERSRSVSLFATGGAIGYTPGNVYVNTLGDWRYVSGDQEIKRARLTHPLTGSGVHYISVQSSIEGKQRHLSGRHPSLLWLEDDGVIRTPRTEFPLIDAEVDTIASQTFYVLPAKKNWGRAIDGAELKVEKTGERLTVSVTGTRRQVAPSDFGSLWYIGLDSAGQVVRIEDAVPDLKPRISYKKKDLVTLGEEALKTTVPIPTKPEKEKIKSVLFGIRITRDQNPEGFELIAKPVELP